MSERQAFIQSVIEELTPAAPKIVTYHNGTLLVFRNGDGDRVATILEHKLSPDEIRIRIRQLYAVKAENIPSQETIDKLKS